MWFSYTFTMPSPFHSPFVKCTIHFTVSRISHVLVPVPRMYFFPAPCLTRVILFVEFYCVNLAKRGPHSPESSFLNASKLESKTDTFSRSFKCKYTFSPHFHTQGADEKQNVFRCFSGSHHLFSSQLIHLVYKEQSRAFDTFRSYESSCCSLKS